jgi:aspartate dehydrogenase
MSARDPRVQRVSIAGLGAVGRELAQRLHDGVPGFELVAVASGNRIRAEGFLDRRSIDVPVVELAELEPLSDIVIECAPSDLLVTIAEPVLRHGKEVVVLSAGALAESPELLDLAERFGGRISVPTGGILGLDAVAATREGGISSVRITSSKPTKGLAGAPYLEQMGIDADQITEPTRVFSGTAREAVKGFPANLNVTMALALAGIGPEETCVDVWVDPTLSRNTHRIEVESEVARLTMTIENVPSENPRTGRITALSVISLLRKRTAALVVGS